MGSAYASTVVRKLSVTRSSYRDATTHVGCERSGNMESKHEEALLAQIKTPAAGKHDISEASIDD
jgi:hypothetical protein